MQTFRANPLGKGNSKLFPPRIEIHENGVKYIQQGAFKGKEFLVPFSEIEEISISTPMIGFASIKIWGGKFSSVSTISGFTNFQVRKMRDLIELAQKNHDKFLKRLYDDNWVDPDEEKEDTVEKKKVDTNKEEKKENAADKKKEERPQVSPVVVNVTTKKAPVAPPPPPPSSFSFYALIDNKQYGPYDKIQFKRLVDNDMVTRDTLVWKEGMEQWLAAKNVPEMEEFFPQQDPSTPPPPPPSPMGPPPPPIG